MIATAELPLDKVRISKWCFDCGLTLSLSHNPMCCPARHKWLCDECSRKNDPQTIEIERKRIIRDIESEIDSKKDAIRYAEEELEELQKRLREVRGY